MTYPNSRLPSQCVDDLILNREDYNYCTHSVENIFRS